MFFIQLGLYGKYCTGQRKGGRKCVKHKEGLREKIKKKEHYMLSIISSK